MKIREIQIQQFGRFDEWKMKLPEEGLLVIHGQNEAGKSTLRQMILSVLFQFPRKPVLDRYLRTKDSRLTRGSLQVTLSDGRSLVAERNTHEKELKLTLENGVPLSKEILTERFGGIDRALYEDVFCFDLDGLQGFDALGATDLNQWLFNASMPGSDEILKLEQSLLKKRDALFKPSGRKPLINSAITALEKSRQSLIKWEQELDRYYLLKKELSETEDERSRLETEYKIFEKNKKQFLRFYALQPFIVDYISVVENKNKVPEVPEFPEQGVERLERLLTQQRALEGQRAQVQSRLEQVDLRIAKLSVTKERKSFYEKNLNRLVEQRPNYDQHLAKKKERLEKKLQIDEKCQRLLSKLGTEWSYEAVEQADIGIEASNTLQLLVEKMNSISERAAESEKNLQRCQADIQERDRRLKDKSKQLLSREEREEYEAVAASAEDSTQNKALRQNLQLQKDYLEKNLRSEKLWKMTGQVTGLIILALTFLSYFLFKTSFPQNVAVIFVIAGIVISAAVIAVPTLIIKRSDAKEQLDRISRELNDQPADLARSELNIEKTAVSA